mmetsp:Transcript_1341/g.3203  ORF Transcript_1341/g.3203 Transcript_1341/m.3203 type:complete len:261 (+) Transcript_1341:336-1118(+)
MKFGCCSLPSPSQGPLDTQLRQLEALYDQVARALKVAEQHIIGQGLAFEVQLDLVGAAGSHALGNGLLELRHGGRLLGNNAALLLGLFIVQAFVHVQEKHNVSTLRLHRLELCALPLVGCQLFVEQHLHQRVQLAVVFDAQHLALTDGDQACWTHALLFQLLENTHPTEAMATLRKSDSLTEIAPTHTTCQAAVELLRCHLHWGKQLLRAGCLPDGWWGKTGCGLAEMQVVTHAHQFHVMLHYYWLTQLQPGLRSQDASI